MFYEHDHEYIPLKIILKDVVGYYNDYKNNSKYDLKYSAKRMNFRLDDNSIEKICNIFEHIEERLGIDLKSRFYEGKRGDEYFKTVVSDYICFRKSKDGRINIIPNENTNYN